MESRHDLSSQRSLLASSLSPAPSLSDLSQPASWSSSAPTARSSTTPVWTALSGQDVVYLNSALDQLAMTQQPQQTFQQPLQQQQHLQHQQQLNDPNGNYGNLASSYSNIPGGGVPITQPDPWYYVQQQGSGQLSDHDAKSGSCSPRQVSFPRSEGAIKTPCAIIAPISPASVETNHGQKHQTHPGLQPSNVSNQGSQPASQSAESAIIRNSSPVATVKLDNELQSSATAHSFSSTDSANLASLKIRERSNNTTCPDNITIEPQHPGTELVAGF